MQLDMIGLGRKGANGVWRLAKDGRKCATCDASPDAVRP